ncbi:MAG: hypothetical protein HZC48_04685 [Nitrospirae bacterium]|nr:hypothetical protein [Nitrospirota bacterium]
MKAIFLIFMLALVATKLLDAVALLNNRLPELSIFGKKYKLIKIFRIDPEMLGSQRKPFAAFVFSLYLGILIFSVGLVMSNLTFLLFIGSSIAGLSFVAYGAYGIYKKEIISPTKICQYGPEAIATSIVYILLGMCFIAGTIYAIYKK